MSGQPETGAYQGKDHILPIRIYYEDTDFSGAVYHAAYLKFMERGRTESFRATGSTHQDLLVGKTPAAFAVRQMGIRFCAQARIDDAIQVKTRLLSAKGARMHAQQTVLRDDLVLVRASVELACINFDGRPIRIPKPALAKMRPFICTEMT